MMGIERLTWIDRMRGLAILSVVMQHLAYNFQNDFVYRDLIGISNMGVFFFVSGYILEKTSTIDSINSAIQFLFKKSIQLMFPFLVWGLFIRKYFFQDSWSTISILDVVYEFEQPHLWFLLTLYGYCFIFAGYRVLSYRLGGGKIYLLNTLCFSNVRNLA